MQATDFELPSDGTSPGHAQLLWMLFDVVRNGQAHQYQQILVELTDQKHFLAALTGAPVARINPSLSYGGG
ncbi:MAG: hypothetical protein ACRDIY_14820, partial [Chloroflexota bacterium]